MKNHSIKDPLVSRVYNANTFISSHHINQVNEECTNPYKIIFLLLVKKSSMPCGVTVWERKEVTKKCYKFYNELKIFFCLRFTDKIYENYDNNFNFFSSSSRTQQVSWQWKRFCFSIKKKIENFCVCLTYFLW